jgi:hypothetical protein
MLGSINCMHWFGKIVQSHGRSYKGAHRRVHFHAWCSMTMTYGFGTLFSAWQELTTTSSTATLSIVCKPSWGTCSTGQLRDQRIRIQQGVLFSVRYLSRVRYICEDNFRSASEGSLFFDMPRSLSQGCRERISALFIACMKILVYILNYVCEIICMFKHCKLLFVVFFEMREILPQLLGCTRLFY